MTSAAIETSAAPRRKATLSPLEKSERRLGLLLLLPAVLLLGTVVLYPISQLLVTSLQFNHLAQPWMGTPFVGLDNFQRALADERFWETTLNTVIYIVVNLVVVNLMRWLERSVAVPGFIGPAVVGGGGH